MVQKSPRKPRTEQINHSKQWILEALVVLMRTCEWQSISLVELANKAGVSRQTLHRHFRSIEDIILWHLDHSFEEFLGEIHEPDKLDGAEAIVTNIDRALRVCEKNGDFLRLLHKQKLDHLFLTKMAAFSRVVFDRMRQLSPDNKSYQERYFAGGFFMVVMHWVNYDTKTPRKEVCTFVSHSMLGQLA